MALGPQKNTTNEQCLEDILGKAGGEVFGNLPSLPRSLRTQDSRSHQEVLGTVGWVKEDVMTSQELCFLYHASVSC